MSNISLPIKRTVRFQTASGLQEGWIAIVAIAENGEDVECRYELKLDVERTGVAYGIDVLQALASGIAILEAHLSRVETCDIL